MNMMEGSNPSSQTKKVESAEETRILLDEKLKRKIELSESIKDQQSNGGSIDEYHSDRREQSEVDQEIERLRKLLQKSM